MTNFNYDERIIEMANYILENKSTIRATAKIFNIPKSTLHHLFCTRLKYINFHLYREVKKLMEENFNIKHIHGGESTKLKYEKLKLQVDKTDALDLTSY